MPLKLTEKSIAKMPAPDPSGKQVLHWDSALKGFAVLCSAVSNARTYVVQRTLPGGKSRRVTIGAVNELALAVARERATVNLLLTKAVAGRPDAIPQNRRRTIAQTGIA